MGWGRQELPRGSWAPVLWGRGRSQGRKRTRPFSQGWGESSLDEAGPQSTSLCLLARKPEAPSEPAPGRMAWPGSLPPSGAVASP